MLNDSDEALKNNHFWKVEKVLQANLTHLLHQNNYTVMVL